MKLFKTLILLIFLSFGAKSQVLTPVKWDVSTKKIDDKNYDLIFKAHIDFGWKLYGLKIPDGGPVATKISIQDNPNIELIGEVKQLSKSVKKHDKSFDMELEIFKKEAVFAQRIKLKSAGDIKVVASVEFMSCDDQRCLPPSDEEFEFNIKAEVNNETKPVSNDSETSLITLFFLAFLGGLAAIFTPCVFPMIPMTVSFFIKQKGKFQALFYGFSIIVIYVLIGTIVAVTLGADFANFLSTHWIPNMIFFAVFIIFAISFFGYFEITMPSFLVNKSSAKEESSGVLGPFFMALTLVLVSFSCTGPIVGTILVASAGGKVLMPIVGMLGFSLAFSLPFTLFALFPSWLQKMPKSGGWLNAVKVVLGFIELALALKFLSIADQAYHWGILDREVYLAFWVVIFAGLVLYLIKKIKFPHDDKSTNISLARGAFAVIVLSFTIYLGAGLFGQPLKTLSGYLPPDRGFNLLNIFDEKKKDTHDASVKYSDFLHLPHGLTGYFDIEQAREASVREGKPIFIDFTGHGCVNCREMEARVWSDPKVLEILKRDYILLALYVDDKTKLPESEWVKSTYDGKMKKTIGKINANYQIEKYNVNAQPYYVLTNENDENLISPKAYDLSIDNFVEFLKKGVEAYKKQK
jgi:thiol:disulfide interchange protein DsbD